MKALTAVFTLSIAMFLSGFSGCASTPQTPQQAVYAARTTYAAALTVAVAYKRLPACTATVSAPCSDPAIVAQLQKADTVASTALDAAETVVRTPGFGDSVVQSAITAAQSALAAFTSITSTLNLGGNKT